MHWPFCLSKCPYCDFNSHVASSFDHNLWLESYIKELEYFLPEIAKRKIKTIFFGGGTPSLMDPSTIEKLLKWLRERDLLAAEQIEITLEANPTSVETKKLEAFRASGINRISIGVQSLISEDLKKLGRTHSPDAAINAITAASKIFDRYSFDLIYAREHQRMLSWQNELEAALKLAGGHISLYQLTIEKGTPFYTQFREGSLTLPENDLAADMYLWTKEYLIKHGYKRYEISNFALPGQESQHNLAYWHYDEYLGIGPGAHSRICLEDARSPIALMNYNKPDKWLNLVHECGHGLQVKETLATREVVEEIMMMGLRLEDGITDEKLQKYLDFDFDRILNKQSIEIMIEKEFVQFDGKRLKLTDKGLLMHSYIVPRVIY